MMQRLTINQIARANLRQNRRAYLSMTIGIFLSIFLITAMCVSIQGMIARQGERAMDAIGAEDGAVFDSGLTDAELLDYGLFEPGMGHIYLTAKTKEGAGIGFYDELGEELLRRSFIEGRMPEKAGEIAAEPSALGLIREDIAVGDAFTLTVLPLDGAPEERTYTLVGILTEQSGRMQEAGAMLGVNTLEITVPAFLLSREEPAYATGRVVTHHLLNFLPGVTAEQVIRSSTYNQVEFFARTIDGRLTDIPIYTQIQNSGIFQYILLLVMLLGSLIVAACVGISGAMESQLARKTEEIGMLRAVGATRRQIRRVFGRESWLLAFLVTPAAVAAGVVAAWALALALSDMFLFRPTLTVLLPVIALSFITILLSSSLPLRRASRIMPMSVLRDTAILRKGKRIKSKKRFRVPRLMAARELRFHPTRSLGAAVLLTAMLSLAALTFYSFQFGAITLNAYPANFVLTDNDAWFTGNHLYFADYTSPNLLTEADINQIASLPLVKELNYKGKYYAVTFPVDRHPEYLKDHDNNHLHYLDPDAQDERPRFQGTYIDRDVVAAHNALQKVLETDRLLVTMELHVVSERKLLDLAAVADMGSIDMDAVNAGRQVLVNVPNLYQIETGRNSYIQTTDPKGFAGQVKLHRWDDYFEPGMTLSLTQLCDPNSDTSYAYHSWTEEDFLARYMELERHDAAVTVGAVVHDNSIVSEDVGLVTTEKGIRAMGLNALKFQSMDINLTQTPDEETEAWLYQRLRQIAYRNPGLRVINYLDARRESVAENNQVLMVLIAVIAVLFAVSLGLITGTVSRRIRADSRTIGILRAVGADNRALTGCYSGQIILTAALGLLGSFALIAVFVFAQGPYYFQYLPFVPAMVAVAAVMDALLLLCCMLMLRQRVRETIHKSIVDNIREL